MPIRLTSDNETDGLGFTLQPMTDQIAPVASQAITDWLGAKKVAIAYDPTEAYTKNVAAAVRSELEEGRRRRRRLRADQARRGRITTRGEEAGRHRGRRRLRRGLLPGRRQDREGDAGAEVEAQCLADYGSYDTGYVDDAGIEAAMSCPVVGVPAPDDFKGSALFVKDFREDFETDPGTWSPYTYDSVNFLAEGVKQTDGFDPDKLNDFLGTGRRLEGLDR